MAPEKLLQKIDIPSYSYKQEKFNSVSHFLGIPIGIVVLVISIILFALRRIDTLYFTGLLIFSISISLLYMMSGMYHGEDKINEKEKKIKRVIDHCTIYILIAGTYTPICLYINSINNIGLITLILEWSLAFIGIIINAIDFTNKYVKAISMFLYLALGWLIIFSGAFIYLTSLPFIFILTGGILYTVGSILYGIGHKNLNFHSVFHIFVLLGTLFQSIGVLFIFM